MAEDTGSGPNPREPEGSPDQALRPLGCGCWTWVLLEWLAAGGLVFLTVATAPPQSLWIPFLWATWLLVGLGLLLVWAIAGQIRDVQSADVHDDAGTSESNRR
jgi:hypothetical protein